LGPSAGPDAATKRKNNNNNNNNNNNGDDIEDSDNVIESKIDSVNHLDSVENFQKAFYDKPKFNIPVDSESDIYYVGGSDSVAEKHLNVHLPGSDGIVTEESVKIVINTEEPENSSESDSKVLVSNMAAVALTSNNLGTPQIADPQQITSGKMSDAFLSGAKEDLLGKGTADESMKNRCEEVMRGRCDTLNMGDSNRVVEEWEEQEKATEKFSKEEQTASEKEKEDSVVPRKKEKMEINYSVKKSCTTKMEPSAPVLQQQDQQAGAVVRRRDFGPRAGKDHLLANRRSVPTAARDKKRSSTEILGA